LPGETRRLDLGPLTKQQRERIEGTRELMERRQKERDGEETSAVQDDTGDRLVAWANRPLTDADRIVAAARAKSLGVEKLPRLQLGGTYWNAPVVGMQGLPERSLENLKVARGQPVVESERVNVRVMLGWDAPRLTQRSEMQIEDDVSINLRYWDGHEGFHGSWRETNDVRTFGRHRTIDKLMDDPQWLHFQYALTMGSELSWPGDSVRFDSKPVALTRYRHVGTEQIDNEVCDIFEGAVRHEMLWIGQSSGLIRARYDRWLHTQRPEYYTDLVQEVAGRTFDDHDRFWDWWKLQTPERQAILSAHWAVAHWALTRPGQITFFSDFKEIALGVEWPMKAERLIVQYVGRSDEDGFNYTRCETVFDVSSTNEEFDVLVTDAIPESGDVIWDWRFDIPVKYDWQPDLTESDIQTLLDAERQKLQESKQRFEAAVQPITDMVGKQAPSLPESGWLDASNAPTPESLRGRPYLLHFWATWCGPCKNELPILQSLHDDGLVVIGVHPDGGDASQDETFREFVAEQGLEYPVVLAGNVNEAIAGYPVKMYPYTIVVDAEGKVAAQGVMFGNPELIKTFR
ncbi:MAG: TlpA family protein disulfide reductase, partial [Planctomycetaceae bacterium]|nr:TlpA family protein disulfide reductase [Planctomycetaceae bacterium]